MNLKQMKSKMGKVVSVSVPGQRWINQVHEQNKEQGFPLNPEKTKDINVDHDIHLRKHEWRNCG